MRYKKEIQILSVLIILLSSIAALVGVITSLQSGNSNYYESIHLENVEIFGKGIYQYDSVSIASQAIAQDIVTLVIAIPLLFVSLVMYRKESLKWKLMLTGTIGYFLYTYTSYSFLSMYNSLFLVYVVLLSLSFFTFTFLLMSYDIEHIHLSFKSTFPNKFIGIVLMIMSFLTLMMWLGRIGPPLLNNEYPTILEHYTTLVIQVLDIGFIVPVSFLAGLLLIKKKPFGYLLAPVFIFKAITMLTAITAMIILLIERGEEVSLVELVLFPAFDIVVIASLIIILKNIKEKDQKVSL